MEDIFKGVGVEITLADRDAFLKVRETLTRIGVSSRKEKVLYQSCHILHKQGRYVILHFKELFSLDGKESTITENDLQRRNSIVKLLEDWDLLKIVPEERSRLEGNMAPLNQIKILTFKEKDEWELKSKYTIGNKKR